MSILIILFVYRVYIVYKAKSQAGNIRVKYIMTTQKGQSLGNLPIVLEIQQRALGPGESAAGAT